MYDENYTTSLNNLKMLQGIPSLTSRMRKFHRLLESLEGQRLLTADRCLSPLRRRPAALAQDDGAKPPAPQTFVYKNNHLSEHIQPVRQGTPPPQGSFARVCCTSSHVGDWRVTALVYGVRAAARSLYLIHFIQLRPSA
jgi:hypothetical protein